MPNVERDVRDDGSGVQPGSVTRLLEALAQAPATELGGAWEAALYPGSVIGKFELVQEIGRGGFGVVWEAKDRELGRHVAFKAVRAGPDAALKEQRLVIEAEAAARLSHPNIVALHDLGRSEHGPFLVLELLRGATLAARLERGPVPVRDAIAIAVEIAKAMAHAHAHGVTHRDLKPANVFVCDDGCVKVLDFGLSHAFGQRRISGGTPAYMAPEQLEDAPEDERTDVFALGVTLYEMLTGRPPYEASGRSGVHRGRFYPPELDVSDAPRLGDVISRLLAPRAVDRPRDGAEVLSLLVPFLGSLERSNAAGSTIRERRKGRWSFQRVALLAGATAGVVGIALALALRTTSDPIDPAERVVVAVADFANETGDRELDGLSGLLTTSLQQSPRLRVLPRGRMLDLLRGGEESLDRLDERRARDAGRRAGVAALVLASVRRVEDVYLVDVQVLDPARDEYLFTTTDRASGKANVLGLVDRISERTRAALHESAAEARQAASRVADVTSNLEAYGSYFAGKACVEKSLTAGQSASCLEALERAVAIDPGFALAWLQLASVRMWVGDDPRGAREAIRTALRFIDRAPQRERIQIRALAAQLEGREDEAAVLFREAAAASPDDRAVQFMTADFFLTRGDLEASLPYWQRGTALDPPGEAVSAFYATKALGPLGRREELEELAKQLEAAPPTPSTLHAMSRARSWLGDVAGAVDAARRGNLRGELALLWIGGTTPSLDPAGAAALQDETGFMLRVIADVLRGKYTSVLALPVPERENWIIHCERAQIAAQAGRVEEARAVAARAAALEPVLSASLSIDLAYAGELEAAEEIARHLAPGSPRERTYRAVALWRRGDPLGALELLDRLARESPSIPGVLKASFLQGEILSDLGRDSEAIRALSRYGGMLGLGLEHALRHPRSLFLLARSHERLGNLAEARAAVDRLLTLWEGADPDLPLLREAKALRMRLE